jgi:predicted metal-dependent peptidase
MIHMTAPTAKKAPDGFPAGFNLKATVEEVEKATKKLVSGRAKVVFFKPLYAPLVFRLVIKAAQWVMTMATDGKSLMFNPKFVAELPMEHLTFSILHEILHCVMRHPSRRGNRDPEIWNIATDLIVNGILVFGEAMPHMSWIVLDRKYYGKNPSTDVDWTAETIYDDLIKDAEAAKKQFKVKCACVQKDPTDKSGGKQESDEDGKAKGDPKDGKGGKEKGDGAGKEKSEEPGEGEGDQDGEGGGEGGDQDQQGFSDPRGWTDVKWDKDIEEEWKQAAIQTEQMAKMRGTTPGWLTSLVDELVEPPVPIEKILQHLVGSHMSQETSWKSPNRRFISRGIVLPSAMRDKKDIVFILDTSGSVGDAEARKFLGLGQRAMKSKGINEMRLMQCDMVICDDQRIKDVASYKLHIKRVGLKGRGGTSFRPPFERLEEEKALWTTACIIYLTDLCGDFPERPPKCPVFWFSTTPNTKAPWGKTFHWDQATDKITVVHGPKAATVGV